MADFVFAAQRILDAPADVIYHCLSDYRSHHRHQPDGFLPPAFTRLDVLRGGVGAGTVIRFTISMGGRATTRTQEVSEPEPGRVLIESGNGESSRFTLEPRPDGTTLLRIETVLNMKGFDGLVMRLLGARVLGPLYQDEMQRLERYAQQHAERQVHSLAS